MRNDIHEVPDDKLTALLKAARPSAELPVGFQGAVWRRIETAGHHSPGVLERLAAWLLMPRVALAGLAVVVLLAAGIGAARGIQIGEREARDQYMTSVDPSYPVR
ncbi:MAG: hypothetical protein C5B50_08520 [Verrucomicrobia bacterium]|nr:MAG: hypothetical protein C5B50_08520 [Verrucomicrobiota bacterium]